MSQVKRQSKDYEKLKAVWYAKLAKSGFKEIEDTRPGKDRLVKWSQSGDFGSKYRFLPIILEARRAYYTMAEHFLHSHKFKNARDKLIWQFHSEGKSLRNISKELKKHGFKGAKDVTHKTVLRLKKVMQENAKNRSDSDQEL